MIMNKKKFITKYFINFCIINLLFFPIAFYQFERPLISLESFIFAISGKFLIFGIVYELICSFFASLQITPDLIFFSFWLNNINFNFINSFMEIYTLAILLIIFYLFYHFRNYLNLNLHVKKILTGLLLGCVLIVTILIFNRPLIKLHFNDLSEVTKFGSTTYSLFSNVKYQSRIRDDLVNSNYLETKFDFNQIDLKKYNNIYIFLMESYPLFVKKEARENVEGFLTMNLESFEIQKQYKNWYPTFSTLGQEFYMFCGFPPKNINEILFSKYQLKDYLKQNKCILDQLKQSGYRTNFIHTYKSTFNNRVSYYDFFDKTYFLEDLVKLNFASDCYWDEAGICDYQVIERFNELFDLKKNKKLFYFLTLNGHVFPRDYFVKKNETRQDCTILDLNNDLMCKVYNNQIQFNKSLNQFIKNNLRKNDLVIAIGDTPPFFLKKKYKRLFINDYVPVFLIEKK